MFRLKPTRDILKYKILDDYSIMNSKKKIVGMTRVIPINFDNLTDDDQAVKVDELTMLISMLPIDELQVYKVDEWADLENFMRKFDELIDTLSPQDPIQSRRIAQLEQEKLELQQRIVSGEVKDKFFYFIYTADNENDLQEVRFKLEEELRKNSFEFNSMGKFETLMQLYRYINPVTSQFVEIPKVKFNDAITLSNLISMDSYSLASERLINDYIASDGVLQKVLYIHGMPKEPTAGWMGSFTDFEDVDYSIHFNKTDSSKLRRAYDKTKSSLKEQADSSTLRESDRKELQSQYDQIDFQQDKMVMGLPFYEVFMTIRIKATSLEELKKIEHELTDLAGRHSFILRQGFGEQNALFETTAPLGVNHFKKSSYCKIIPADTIGFGFPFIHETLVDDNLPIEIGQTFSGGVVLLDTTLRTSDRPNSNEWISGIAGAGKTMLMMLLIHQRFARGEKQFIFDVVGEELKRLVQDLGGDVIDASSNKNSMVNPLQVRMDITERDGDEPINFDEVYPLALHIFFLRQFFNLVLGTDIPEKRKLIIYIEELLIDLYGEYGINIETSASELLQFKPTDYPTFKDFYEYVEARYQEASGHPGKGTIPLARIEDCMIYIKGLGVGADSTIFSGHTNVDLDNSLTILYDISKLQGRDDTVLSAQYYNLISYTWGWMISYSGPYLFKRIYADEIHAMLSPDLPDLSKWMRKISKENRKFYAGLTAATQELADALKGDSATQGASILANSVYQFFLPSDIESRRMLEAENRYDKADLDFIEKKAKRGECLFRYGQANMRVKIEMGYLFEYFESLKH